MRCTLCPKEIINEITVIVATGEAICSECADMIDTDPDLGVD